MRVKNLNMIPNGAVSLGASANLAAVSLEHISNYSIQIVFTGTPSGTFKLQCSNDELSPSNWTDVGSSDQAVTTAGDLVWNVENAGYKWVRVVYTRSSSTGSLTVGRCNIKGV